MIFPPEFINFDNKFSNHKPSEWKFTKEDVSPHDGALMNNSMINNISDDATYVISLQSKLYDGSFGLSIKAADKSKFTIV